MAAKRRAIGLGLLLWSGCAGPDSGMRSSSGAEGKLGGFSPIAWVQLGPESSTEVRIIMPPAQDCPSVDLGGGAPLPTQAFAAVNGSFAYPTCALRLPPEFEGTFKILTNPRIELKTTPRSVRRIAVVGDTGCRIKNSYGRLTYQDCKNPAEWPWAQVARSITQWKPELTIHTGDLIYREAQCPAGAQDCHNLVYGDRWDTWKEDFFDPAAELIRRSPMLFIRGNHEACNRAGSGWRRFFGPASDLVSNPLGPPSDGCSEQSPGFWVNRPPFAAMVLDSARVDENRVQKRDFLQVKGVLQAFSSAPVQDAFLFSHRPFWAVEWNSYAGKSIPLTLSLQKAAQGELPPSVGAVVSGHLHLWATYNFRDGGPPQMIVGNGGAELDHFPENLRRDGGSTGMRTATEVNGLDQFGFVTMEYANELPFAHQPGWIILARNVEGQIRRRCELSQRRLSCPVW